MKLASRVILALVVLVFGFWFFFVKAPGPDQVCDHIIETTIAEAGERGMAAETQADILERMRARCIEHKLDKIQLRGRLKYADYAKCVMSTKTLAEINAC